MTDTNSFFPSREPFIDSRVASGLAGQGFNFVPTASPQSGGGFLEKLKGFMPEDKTISSLSSLAGLGLGAAGIYGAFKDLKQRQREFDFNKRFARGNYANQALLTNNQLRGQSELLAQTKGFRPGTPEFDAFVANRPQVAKTI